MFSGNKYADGADKIISDLKKHQIKASFFLTGNFYRNKKFVNIIQKLKKDGHYLGAHSDRHLLYCDWDKRRNLLVSKADFLRDLHKNYMEMKSFGIDKQDAVYYLPPFEWYNEAISAWTAECGLQLINLSPGTMSHADYTVPSMGKRYLSSNEIAESILLYEKKSPTGLNGFILLMHIGVQDERNDKLYNKFSSIVHKLTDRGYRFIRIDQLLELANKVPAGRIP